MGWQLSITNWTSAKLLFSSGFWMENEHFKVCFLLWFKDRDLKVPTLEESGHILAHKNKHFSNGN